MKPASENFSLCCRLLWLWAPALAVGAPPDGTGEVQTPPPVPHIMVMDDSDREYAGKSEYKDNLQVLDTTGRLVFEVSGLNNCQSIGSSKMLASDPDRSCLWVMENVSHRIRRFQWNGKATLTISDIKGAACAVDPKTGNLWVLQSEGSIGSGKTVVYDAKGKVITSHDITGWDIAYDRSAEAFWIADNKLTKVIAATGQVVFSQVISAFCATSVDVDQGTGSGWVTVRNHPDIAGSSNRLMKFDPVGGVEASVDLEAKVPVKVSVDPLNSGVWVALAGKSVQRYSSDGKLAGEFPVNALTLQADPAGGAVWVVTPDEVQKIDLGGRVSVQSMLKAKTGQAWIGAVGSTSSL